ncbi:hypothetical protein [Mycolicibacterium fortuitum]|uniref:hypothetical protein n=1 Tax=Mycolicibacterium fortuitum TaxID=1766 RepID=UPI001CDC7500|nr:hypothetical protein [Mycolicibacterium fortuitum]UBV14988.1 hypothetical protein H8Z57_30620 [Mycolicibacterium fortuitum]
MTSPYSTYAEKMALVATEAEALAEDMRAAKSIAPDAEGLTADTINAGFDNDADAMMAIADAAREAACVANEQTPADAKFAAAPKESDVAEAYRAVQTAEERGAAPEEIRKARNRAADLAAEREDAKAEHAAVSRRTTAAFEAIKVAEVPLLDVPTPTVRRANGRARESTPGTTNGQRGGDTSNSNSANGGGGGIPLDSSSSSGGSSLSDADASTALSADGSGVPMTAQQLAGQPQTMGQQPGAMGGQPQMQPMGQMGAVPSTGAGNLSTGTASRGKRKDDKRSDNGAPIAPTMAPMSFGNTGVGGAVDRGSSTSGVTTNANTSGGLKTALSGAVVPPGTGSQPGMMARGMGGGMMGGAPGAGGAGGGNSKERPVIYDANRPDEVERSDSIQTGTLSRDTALDPNVVEERERQK